MDFAGLPPEVNSGRMYAGAGAGSLTAAASAWDGLSVELTSAAASYRSAVSGLTSGSWLGPSSTSMAAAATPYVEWMNTTAVQAQHTASQARSAAAAYETAFAATVPPTEIAANRSTLASLVAGNVLGQNTAAIAANETAYGEMWAQDAAAMNGYAGASAAAAQLTPFSSAPQTTTSAGATTQAAATSTSSTAQAAASSAQSGSLVTALENFLNEPVVSDLGTLVGILGNDDGFPLSGVLFDACLPGFFLGPLLTLALPNLGIGGGLISDVSGSGLGAGLADSVASLGGADVSAGLGRAASVGGLSVPQAWGSAAPEIRLAAKALPMAGSGGLPESEVAAGPGGWFGGIPPVGSVVNAPRTGEPGARTKARPKVMAQMPGESGSDHTRSRSRPPERRARDLLMALSDGERDELDELRKEIAEMEMERDAAARLIKEAIRP